MKEIDMEISMCGDPDKVAKTRMYVLPDGRFFPVLGEPIAYTVEGLESVGALV